MLNTGDSKLFALVCLLTMLPLAQPTPVLADDWPQWFGPQRDGVWREEGLIDAFPAAGTNVRWRMPVGGGYAGPAVAGGRVFVMDYTAAPSVTRPANPFQRISQPGVERVLCFDEQTGKHLWQYAHDVAYTMSYSAGPRATPTVDGNRVYTLGGEGDLACLDAATGSKIWAIKLSDDTHPTPMWGFSSHPLIDGDHLILLTGGADPEHGRGAVTAFDKRTGNVIWTSLSSKEPGYSPVTIIQSGGARQLIAWLPDGVHSLDPASGKEYWQHRFGPVRMALCVMTPRFVHDSELGDLLYVSTQYEGSLVLKLDIRTPAATVLWKRVGKSDRNSDALHILLSTPSVWDHHIYGVDAYGQLRCLNLKNGDRLWETFAPTTYDTGPQKWTAAFLIHLGDTGNRYLIANEHGDLILADLTPAGYHEISRTHVLEPTNSDPGRAVVWSHPALADRFVFWRNDKEILCVEMGRGKE